MQAIISAYFFWSAMLPYAWPVGWREQKVRSALVVVVVANARDAHFSLGQIYKYGTPAAPYSRPRSVVIARPCHALKL